MQQAETDLPPAVLARLNSDRAAIVMLHRMARDYADIGCTEQAASLREHAARRSRQAQAFREQIRPLAIPAFPA